MSNEPQKQDTFTKLMKNLGILPQDATDDDIQKRRSLAHFFKSTKELKELKNMDVKDSGSDTPDTPNNSGLNTKSPRTTVLQSPRSMHQIKEKEGSSLKEIKDEKVDSPHDSKDSKSPTTSRKSSEIQRFDSKSGEAFTKSMGNIKEPLKTVGPKVEQIIQKRRSIGNENQLFQRDRSNSEIYFRDKTKRVSRIDEIEQDNQDKVFVIFKDYDKLLQKTIDEKDELILATLEKEKVITDPIVVSKIKNPNKPDFHHSLTTKSNESYSDVIKKVNFSLETNFI